MAFRAVQLNISSEDTARVTGLPQSVSSGQQSMWPKQLTWLVSDGSHGLHALPRHGRSQRGCFAVPGAGPSMLCHPMTAGRVDGSGAATRHVSSDLCGRNNPNKCTSDLNPPSRAFILQSAGPVPSQV